jgi:hypothetical protein
MGVMSTTDAPTPTDEDAAPSPELAAPVEIGGWPTWLRRSFTALVLVAVAAIAFWGAQAAKSGEDAIPRDGTVVALTPPDGAQALRQTAVGAELAPGYDGRLTVNGIAIPEEQMEGARDPATVEPDDLQQNGLRPNNRNRVFFSPGPGQVIEEFDNGTVDITLRYFPEQIGEGAARSVTWQIRVS